MGKETAQNIKKQQIKFLILSDCQSGFLTKVTQIIFKFFQKHFEIQVSVYTTVVDMDTPAMDPPPALDTPDLDVPDLDIPDLDTPDLDTPALDDLEIGKKFESTEAAKQYIKLYNQNHFTDFIVETNSNRCLVFCCKHHYHYGRSNKQTGAAEWSSLSYHGFTCSDLFGGLVW